MQRFGKWASEERSRRASQNQSCTCPVEQPVKGAMLRSPFAWSPIVPGIPVAGVASLPAISHFCAAAPGAAAARSRTKGEDGCSSSQRRHGREGAKPWQEVTGSGALQAQVKMVQGDAGAASCRLQRQRRLPALCALIKAFLEAELGPLICRTGGLQSWGRQSHFPLALPCLAAAGHVL